MNNKTFSEKQFTQHGRRIEIGKHYVLEENPISRRPWRLKRKGMIMGYYRTLEAARAIAEAWQKDDDKK